MSPQMGGRGAAARCFLCVWGRGCREAPPQHQEATLPGAWTVCGWDLVMGLGGWAAARAGHAAPRCPVPLWGRGCSPGCPGPSVGGGSGAFTHQRAGGGGSRPAATCPGDAGRGGSHPGLSPLGGEKCFPSLVGGAGAAGLPQGTGRPGQELLPRTGLATEREQRAGNSGTVGSAAAAGPDRAGPV